MNIKKNVLNGLKWTSFSSIVIAIFQILQISILARFLSSQDFGLMAILTVVIGFIKIFADLGISNAIIHHKENNELQLSSLYWLNIIIGISLFILILIISPLISNFYNEPRLKELLIILSFSFVIQSFGNQFKILFQKELNFNIIAKIEILSAFFSLLVAVILAYFNYGVYTLIIASLTSISISSFLFFILGIKIHKPKFLFSFIEIKKYLNFGAYQTGQSTLNYFNSQFDVILIGKLLGAESLGVYSIVKQLAMRPSQIINPIVTRITFPILSKLQDNIVLLKDTYLKTVHYISLVNFPIYLLSFVLAEPIVIILLGKEWSQSIPIFQILSLYFMVRSVGNPIGSLVMATGKVKIEFWWNVVMFCIFPLSIYIGSIWLNIGVAYSLFFTIVLTLVPMWHFIIKKLCKATFKEFFFPLFKILIICLIVLGISTVTFLINVNIYFQSIIYILTFSILYLFSNLKYIQGINK
ncbi:MOP flippase family protein [Arcobacter sp. s6]|uniref:MOP flippase family protein n=1 Tax=Arcobacter sp. s6 TaxID=3230363 RepID=UPI00349FD492